MVMLRPLCRFDVILILQEPGNSFLARGEGEEVASVGIISNPQSGKDIRRLVALASSVSNNEKVLMLRRVMAGIIAMGLDKILMFNDLGSLGAVAVDGFHHENKNSNVQLFDVDARGETTDSTKAARKLSELGVRCIIVLGGDGTCRAVAKGCGKIPLIPLSTGTNNAFPFTWEGTVAGMAAALYAHHPRIYRDEKRVTKQLHVNLDDDSESALIDIAITKESFYGARAIWDIERVDSLALTRSEPGRLGLSSLGASLRPIDSIEPVGLWLELGANNKTNRFILSPIGPGQVTSAHVKKHEILKVGESVHYRAPGDRVLAFDGEREYLLSNGEDIEISLRHDGPAVLNVPAILNKAAVRGDLRTKN